MNYMDILNILESSFSSYGYLIVFFAALLESFILLGFLLPGGLIVLLGGYFAQRGQLSAISVIILAWLGMFLGDMINYWLGKNGFHKIFIKHLRLGNFLKNHRLADDNISKYGILAIFYSHILGYMRSIICFSAGVVSFPERKYISAVLGASFFWSFIYVGMGFIFGKSTQNLLSLSNEFTVFAWLVLILFISLKILQTIIHRLFFQLKKS